MDGSSRTKLRQNLVDNAVRRPHLLPTEIVTGLRVTSRLPPW
jgi:hypothetical protein